MTTVPRPVVGMRWVTEEDLLGDPYPDRPVEIGIGPLVAVDSTGAAHVLDVAVVRFDAVTLVQMMTRAKELLDEKAAQVAQQHSDLAAWRLDLQERLPETGLLQRVLEGLYAA